MWKACSTCKKPVAFGAKYFVCSVSTCQRERVGFQFCAQDCWDAHVPMMRHREAWAEERRAPTEQLLRAQEAALAAKPAPAPKPPAAVGAPRPAAEPREAVSSPGDVLVVVSKLKAYIKDKSGMSTSDSVIPLLSNRLRRLADGGMASAQRNGRKTVLDRDF